MSENKPDLMAELAEVPCSDCGMPCAPNEYHPFAACLMFKACHNSEVVRANLFFVVESGRTANHAELEAVARGAGYWRKLMQWHDAPKGNKYATVVFWEAGPHEPENALELVNAMNRALHNSAREGL